MPENSLFSRHTNATEDALFDPAHDLWAQCDTVTIDRFWNGRPALRERGHNWPNLTHVRSLWGERSLFFYFESWFDSLHVNPTWEIHAATEGLAERDVVEVFLRPEGSADYFEFEVSPLGQWLDVRILKPRAEVDFQWESGLAVKAISAEGGSTWRAFLGIPYRSMLAVAPEVGASWRLNLFRIAGQEPFRDYLAWRPTFTEQPDFHVPSAFGHIIFLDKP
ncbi:MAG: carbohydrate-binding family 9-like protein [Acidobacteriota bacterium]